MGCLLLCFGIGDQQYAHRSSDKKEERERTENPTSTSARHIIVKIAKRSSDKLFSALNRIAEYAAIDRAKTNGKHENNVFFLKQYNTIKVQ